MQNTTEPIDSIDNLLPHLKPLITNNTESLKKEYEIFKKDSEVPEVEEDDT
jgi:hypothetical protein